MDGQRFDEFARRVATRSSRRGLLASVGASVLALAGLSSARAKRGKIGLCHRTRSGSHPLTYIEIDQHAVAAHLAHGDVIAPDFGSDASHCGGCGNACDDGNRCTVDTCVDAACVHTPVDCSHLDTTCAVGVCDAGTGACGISPINEDACCTTTNGLAGQCVAGLCTVPPEFATDPENCGGCGISCDDGNPCTVDTCVNGACVHTAKDCTHLDTECTVGVCVNGTCTAVNRNEGHCCGTAGSGSRCTVGVCTPYVCEAGFEEVGGICVPLPPECMVGNCRCGFEEVGGICVPLPNCIF